MMRSLSNLALVISFMVLTGCTINYNTEITPQVLNGNIIVGKASDNTSTPKLKDK